jgi:uncharacterized protein YbjT (DUF2867 family)
MFHHRGQDLVIMKIVLIGATGNIGGRVAIEALSRGTRAPSSPASARAV